MENDGYLYIIYDGHILSNNRVKIGMTRDSSMKSLLTRYKTYFPGCRAIMYYCFNRLRAESAAKKYFSDDRICNSELYEMPLSMAILGIRDILTEDVCQCYGLLEL